MHIALTAVFVLTLAFLFANVEIQIEGAAGWAANLPTWRVEKHWLLDLFYEGRTLTGYHAWVFPFVALFFHFPFAFAARWSWRGEARAVACILLFWLVEDWLWFVLNPAFGLAQFAPQHVPWHKHWLGPAPVDYWISAALSTLLLWVSARPSASSVSPDS
jgi:hypothetical protein